MRGDGVVEHVDGDCPPKEERIVGDDDGFDFPLQEESSPGGIASPEGKSVPVQVLGNVVISKFSYAHARSW